MEGKEPNQPAPEEGAVTIDAIAIAASTDGHVRLLLADGSEQQLSAHEEMSEFIRPGLRVVLYQGPNRELLGWFLPEHGIGRDLRPPDT